ncbi:ral guanine nucleotide dissociation stimulator-like [Castor canadensis]|uniref:Ral guanine nucleotide dissociation stimulator-like n=1 Tax=Castor canadensis TaxID=51338 RepID=A0AC58LBZ5_CASCN
MPHVLAFPPDLVAKRSTQMDAGQFRNMVPYHYLCSIWCQQDKKGNEHHTPTVCATIIQFNNVATCVMTICLCDWSMKAPDRAWMVEHWIEVAGEYGVLNNFSSLYAILSALQNIAICHLKRTWKVVSRESFQKFEKLSRIFSPEKNHSLSRKLLTKGIIPYLGTFLTDLEMLNNVPKYYLYEHFGAWFLGMDDLSKAQSYKLSCDFEPLPMSASSTHKTKKTAIGSNISCTSSNPSLVPASIKTAAATTRNKCPVSRVGDCCIIRVTLEVRQ